MSAAFLQWLQHLGGWSYVAIFGLVFAESGLLLILPGETVVLLAGVLSSRGILSLPLLMLVATVAAMLGDATGYAIGRGPARHRFEARGRFLFVRRADAVRVRGFLDRHGVLAIVGSRFVGVLRVASPFVCGLIEIPPRRFFAYNLPACLAWGVGIAGLGDLGGNAWEEVHRWIGRISLALGAAALLGAIAWAKWRRTLKEP